MLLIPFLVLSSQFALDCLILLLKLKTLFLQRSSFDVNGLEAIVIYDLLARSRAEDDIAGLGRGGRSVLFLTLVEEGVKLFQVIVDLDVSSRFYSLLCHLKGQIFKQSVL